MKKLFSLPFLSAAILAANVIPVSALADNYNSGSGGYQNTSYQNNAPSNGGINGWVSGPGNWAGTYVGGFAGGTWADFTNRGVSTAPRGNDSAFTFGGDIGHNWQYDHMIIGAEGDFTKLDNHSGASGVKYDEDWMLTARARLGYAMGNLLPYITGGLGLTDTVAKVSGVGRSGKLQPGYALGGGADAHLSGNWFARIEYLYVDVPTDNYQIGNSNVAGGAGNHSVRLGLNYKF